MKPNSPIFRMFGRSPIRPLQGHMAKVTECAKHLLAFIAATLEHDWAKAERIQESIIACEHQADDLKRDLRTHLPKSLFLPFSRGDLLSMLKLQDNIANIAKDIAGLIIGRKMHIPEQIAMRYIDLLKRSIDAVEQTANAVNELDELLETGFRGAEVAIIEDMIDEIHQIEHDTDEIQIDVRKTLFALEKDISPVDIIFLYKMIQWTGDLADNAEQVGNLLQSFLAN
ncbi:MAG: TIGR00153 family protein [Legionellales bacterium]|nr:TIGR00153 family protein [Legionellales bacterium]|tara:strand:+ start:2554 stop:3234 length:681 start_codon:yes stop_codon:yes gene_type:complete